MDSIQTFTCQACGTDFSRPKVRGTRPKWCPDCREIAYRLDHERQCETCGRQGVRRDGRYCSQSCQFGNRDRRRPAPYPDAPACVVIPLQHPARQWSGAHASTTWRAGACATCGASFVTKNLDRTCSEPCGREHKRRARAAGKANYKALTRGARSGAVTATQWGQRLREFEGRCAYCGSAGVLEMEHMTPLSRGGANTIANIVPACRACNQDKGASTVNEWLARPETPEPARAPHHTPPGGPKPRSQQGLRG